MLKILTSLTFLAFISSCAMASEALTSASMDEVIAKVEEKSAQYGRGNVLVVFDIDNTILTATNDLGSDQWYSWQEKIMKEPNCRPLCITNDPNKLIEAQGLLFSMMRMVPTENDLALKIKNLQAKGQKVILLTSRGSDFRSLTELSLSQNNMNFSSSSFLPTADVAGTYLPYEIGNLSRYGLTDTDVQTAGLKDARPVSFMNGVYMTAGQNKGVMLKVLLNKYRRNYKAIVFADDHQRHVDRMQAIMGNLADVTTYRYSKIDPEVEKFNASDKRSVTERWYKLVSTIKAIGF